MAGRAGNYYERVKINARERILASSLAARDIAPLPPIGNPARRFRCKNDLRRFCTEYLPQWFNKPFGRIHYQLIEGLSGVILNDSRLAIAAPRGTGKSTLTIAAIVWALLYGHKRFVIALSANIKEARKVIEMVRSTLARRGPIYEDFPEVSYPIKRLNGTANLARGQLFNGVNTNIKITTERLTLPTISGSQASGSTVIALGIRSALRGQSIEIEGEICRPDFLLLDDIQTDDVSVSPSRIEALEEKLASTVKGLAESGKDLSMAFTCTVKEQGDLPDRILDHEIYPQWNGIRGKALEKMPVNLDAWREYRDKRFLNPEAAREFYRLNKDTLSEGAVVSWPENFDPAHYEDALEFEMAGWAENERAFFSERQNSPLRPATGAVCVPQEIIASRLNGLEYREAPHLTQRITGFIDVHDDLLYYAVTAWDGDFRGSIIDYGTFPEQSRRYFRKGESNLKTLKTLFGESADVNLSLGLRSLIEDLTTASYTAETDRGEVTFVLDRLLVDARYKPEIVEQAIKFTGSRLVTPCRGTGIKSTGKPMATWAKKTGRIFGWHLIEESVPGRSLRSLLVDTNYWKSKLHEKLALNPVDKGSLSFWGKYATEHRMAAEHCNAEKVTLVSAGENTVNEWTPKPTAPDNHLFDCFVGCLVGASVCGLKTDDQPRSF